MTILFSDCLSRLEDLSEKGWLYFFSTKPQANDIQGFIKFGETTRTIRERFSEYRSSNPTNIFCVQVPVDETIKREWTMTQIFNRCIKQDNIDIWRDKGREYLKGNLDLMLRIFLHFSLMTIDDINNYRTNSVTIDNIKEWIETIPLTSYYKIEMFSTKKEYKMFPEFNNILILEKINYKNKYQSSTKNRGNTEEENNKIIIKNCISSISIDVLTNSITEQEAPKKIEELLSFSPVQQLYQVRDAFNKTKDIKVAIIDLAYLLNLFKNIDNINDNFKNTFLQVLGDVFNYCIDQRPRTTTSFSFWNTHFIDIMIRLRDLNWLLKYLEPFIAQRKFIILTPEVWSNIHTKAYIENIILIDHLINLKQEI